MDCIIQRRHPRSVAEEIRVGSHVKKRASEGEVSLTDFTAAA